MWERAAPKRELETDLSDVALCEVGKLKTENRKRRALALTPALALLYVDFATCPIALA
jgi:hypothetical protein